MRKELRMSTIIPQGEAIRKAVKWVSEQRQEHADKELLQFVNDACAMFDLSPKDSQFLIRFFTDTSST